MKIIAMQYDIIDNNEIVIKSCKVNKQFQNKTQLETYRQEIHSEQLTYNPAAEVTVAFTYKEIK